MDHSLSPVLHAAAYRALGLEGWTYERVDCPDGALAGIVDSSPPERVGYSVTMPGKFEALAYATEVSDRARTVGSANTLVRREASDGAPAVWCADCTDVDGAAGALAQLPGLPREPRAVVAGVGGTARPVLAGLASAGVREVVLLSRRPNAGPVAELARDLGMEAGTVLLDDPSAADVIAAADVLVSTVPVEGARAVARIAGGAARIFDVLYAPRPTPLGALAEQTGADVVGGDVMLLHQAFGQVELFTGRPAPRQAMADALAAALDGPPAG